MPALPLIDELKPLRFWGPRPVQPENPSLEQSLLAFLERQTGAFLAVFGFLLVAGVALVDYRTGPDLSFSVFYFVAIAVGAWWGGFSHGILLSLAAVCAWQWVDTLHGPGRPPVVLLWNGIVRFGSFAFASSVLTRLRGALRYEQTLARTDPLTGAANARTFFEVAQLELQRFGRAPRPLTLAYFDLDNFKEVNDRLGHAAGDQLLRRVAETISHNTRAVDLVARLGGDEFVLLMPETDGTAAVASLQRLRVLLNKAAADTSELVACSIGAVTFAKAPRDVEEMVHRADALMYAVKQAGKGQLRHEVVLGKPGSVSLLKRDRRASVRALCNRTACVAADGCKDQQFGTVRNLSRTGIAVRLDQQLPERSLLTIEPLSGSRAKTLLARVVRSSPDVTGWLHGCELSCYLSEEELQDWLT
jgi:diguanylate cyclase (GGDEF)-like protein